MSMLRKIRRNIRERKTGKRSAQKDEGRRDSYHYQGRRPIERKRPIEWIMRRSNGGEVNPRLVRMLAALDPPDRSRNKGLREKLGLRNR